MNELLKTFAESDDSTKVIILFASTIITFIVFHSLRRMVEALSPYQESNTEEEEEND